MAQRDPSSPASVPVILYCGGTGGFGTIRASNSSDCGFSPSSDDIQRAITLPLPGSGRALGRWARSVQWPSTTTKAESHDTPLAGCLALGAGNSFRRFSPCRERLDRVVAYRRRTLWIPLMIV
jgi:hypothetical protein